MKILILVSISSLKYPLQHYQYKYVISINTNTIFLQKSYTFINLNIIFTYVVKQIHFEFWCLAAVWHNCWVNNLLRLNSMEIARVEEPMSIVSYYHNYYFLKILILII